MIMNIIVISLPHVVRRCGTCNSTGISVDSPDESSLHVCLRAKFRNVHLVLGSWFWVLGSGFSVLSSGFWLLASGFWFPGSGFWVLGSGFRVPVSGFWVLGSGF